MREHYRGNHMFVPWGEDFAWANASMNYKSGKALLENFSQKFDDMTILFSNPYQYVEALRAQEIVWPVRYADMFPYANGGNNYWTGFYTSRPDSKYQVRRGQADLHAASQFFTLKALDQSVPSDDLKDLRHAYHSMMDSLGIYQHHDAVSGTAKDPVAKNYYDHLDTSMSTANTEYGAILAQ
jgi:lysosomal alpha-mannosidase